MPASPPARQVHSEFYTPIPRVPELVFLGVADTGRAWGGPLTEHRHECMEINYLHHGSLRWWAQDSWSQVRGGDIYVTWPNEPHGGGPHLIEPCTLFWLQVPLWPGGRKGDRAMLDLPVGEADLLVRRLRDLPQRHFRAGAGLHLAFTRLLECLAHPGDELSITEARLRVLQVLVDVVRAAGSTARTQYSPLVAQALTYMSDHLDRRVPLSEIATELSCSLPHLKKRFRTEVGMSPAGHQTLARVRAACQRLSDSDESVTRIAVTLGFGSAQYFATTFKRWMGMTPHEYRDGVGGRSSRGGSAARRPDGTAPRVLL